MKVFNGQHKATAQVLLGVRELPVRVFIDPDPGLLLTTNTNAGTTLPEDAEDFSERDLVQHFKGESREMKRYILDSVRHAITHSPENQLTSYIDFGGKGVEKPLSYSTIEKTFYSFFIYPDVLDTPLNYEVESGMSPRDLEIAQGSRLMNLIAEEIYIGQFDPDIGTYRIENRIQKDEHIPEPHLRAFRLSKEEILYSWLRLTRQIVQHYFNFMGKPVDEKKLFQYPFPQPLWDHLHNYVSNLKKLPVWVNPELSLSVFGGKLNYEFWQTVFETGKSPHGQVLGEPLNLMDLIKD